MHKGDTIPGIITALFGFSVAIYTLMEDTMRVNAQSSDGVPGAGFFPVLLGLGHRLQEPMLHQPAVHRR